MTDLLVVRSKLKSIVGDIHVAEDLAEHLSKKVENILKEAVERAKANGRRTVQAKDL